MMRDSYRNIIFKLSPVVFISLLGLGLYFRALKSPFLFDDIDFIANNPAIYNLKNFQHIWKWNYPRSMGTLSFAIDYHFYQFNVIGYHLTNLVIHLLTSLLVWWFLQLVLATPNWQNERIVKYKNLISLLAALVFVSHPVATEAVIYITQRYASLAALFYMAALCLYLKGRLEGKNIVAQYGFFFGCGLLIFAGMLTRPTVITCPLMIVLLEIYFLNISDYWRFFKDWSKWIYLVPIVFIVIFIPNVYSFNLSGILKQQLVSYSHDHEIITSGSYFLTQARVLCTYIRLLFIPIDQRFDYDYPLSYSFFEPATFLSFLILVLIFWTAARLFKNHKLISFGILWFFVTLSVESTIIPIHYVIAEYRLYLPLVGFSLVLANLFFYFIKNFRLCTALLLTVVLGFSYLTIKRSQIWQEEVKFWEDAVKKAPNKSRPYDNLAVACMQVGDYPKAFDNLKRAMSINPFNFETYVNFADLYIELNQPDLAIPYLNRALALRPQSVTALNNLGVAYMKLGQMVKAEESFITAIKLRKGYSQPALNLARLYEETNRPELANDLYEQLIRIYPHEKKILFSLLKLYLKEYQKQKASDLITYILQGNKDVVFLTNVGSLLASENYHSLAMVVYEKVLSINPKYKEVYLELGKLYGNLGHWEEAILIWQDGKKRDPLDLRFDELIQRTESLKQK